MRNLLNLFDFSVFKESKYCWFFLEFLISESPNIIQIIGFPILFGVLIKTNEVASFFISFFTSSILIIYLVNKFRQNMLDFPRNLMSFYELDSKNLQSIFHKTNCYFLILSLLIFNFIKWIISLNY